MGSVGCLPAFSFSGIFGAVLQPWDSGNSKRICFLGSYGSESKVHLVRFETSAKFVGGRMLDHFSSTKQPRELRMEEVEQLKRILCMAARILQQF